MTTSEMSKSPWPAVYLAQIQAHAESLAKHIIAMEERERRLRQSLEAWRKWFKRNNIALAEALERAVPELSPPPPYETFDVLDD